MKVLQHLFLGAAFAVAAISIHAQTTTYAFGNSGCSIYIVDCDGVPLNSATTNTTAFVYLAPYNSLQSGRWIDLGGLNLGFAVVNNDSTYTYTTMTVGGVHVPSSISMTFSGTSNSGQPYTGTATIVLGNYLRRCYRGCYWYYSVLGGTLTVQLN